jgi:hypothetical protein
MDAAGKTGFARPQASSRAVTDWPAHGSLRMQEDVRLAMYTRQHGINRWTELCQHLPGKTADDCCSRCGVA